MAKSTTIRTIQFQWKVFDRAVMVAGQLFDYDQGAIKHGQEPAQ